MGFLKKVPSKCIIQFYLDDIAVHSFFFLTNVLQTDLLKNP